MMTTRTYELLIATNEYLKYRKESCRNLIPFGFVPESKYMLFEHTTHGMVASDSLVFSIDCKEEMKLRLTIIGVGKIVSTRLIPRADYNGKHLFDINSPSLFKIDHSLRNKHHFIQSVMFETIET